MTEQENLRAKLGAAVARHLGNPGDISDLKRLTGGATKATWSFSARIGDDTVPLVVQLSRPRASLAADDPLAELPRVVGRDDAAMMIAAAAAGVPAPPVRATLTPEDGLGPGVVMGFVAGETIARRILREERFAPLRRGFAAQCGVILGRIHAMDRAPLSFLKLFGAAENIALYRRVFDACDHPQPVIELGLRWAEDHVPDQRRSTVVHGDFRLGNLICGTEDIRAVIDWEIGALGDPLQDLGWLCVRTWRFGGRAPVGGIGSRADLFAAYERATGTVVDPAHVRFWEAFGSIKWAIMCLMKGQEHRRTGKRTVEQQAIGRRMEEPLHDFLQLLAGED
ncbi:MAG TPA: phosphotransferase family protein [Stellaceae bacterium]|nr:phosphotransferase family protein [Stellaceae bacterium]